MLFSQNLLGLKIDGQRACQSSKGQAPGNRAASGRCRTIATLAFGLGRRQDALLDRVDRVRIERWRV